MECRFYVGQKVVCIDADPWTYDPDRVTDGNMNGLETGVVYTVRGLSTPPEDFVSAVPDAVWVFLAEIHRPIPSFQNYETGFRWTRFRPATDISSLEALLHVTPTPAKRKENV